MPRKKRYSVVIVGAGPSGLALAIELGSRGIDCLVVERHERVGLAPRAKTTNVRTRTHLRRWGIADRLVDASPFGIDYPSDVAFVTRLGGLALARIEKASNCDPAHSDLYPEHGQWVPQYKLEQILREYAETLSSVEFCFNAELVAARPDSNSVELTLLARTEDGPIRIGCDYAVGADGARSTMRDIIGARMTGEPALSRNYNIVFRAPGLAAAHPHGRATMYWQVNADMPGLIGPMDAGDIWFFMPTRLSDGQSIGPDTAAAMIRRSTGIDLPYEIISSDEWIASSLIADRYSDRRMFLIGDACHLHPPFGGYGMNMGVADAVDLGWKLAAVLQGWGGVALPASYEIERRAIHEQVIAEAASNHAILSNDLWSDGLEDAGPQGDALRRAVGERIVAAKEREFHTLGTVLGARYGRSPILPDTAEPGMARDGRHYEPSSEPGCLAPHLWRSDGRSLYDLFGAGFTLIAHAEVPAHQTAPVRAEATAIGAPVTNVQLEIGEGRRLYPAALTLVRPDQHVAWRGDHWEAGALWRAAGHDPSTVARTEPDVATAARPVAGTR